VNKFISFALLIYDEKIRLYSSFALSPRAVYVVLLRNNIRRLVQVFDLGALPVMK